MTGAYTLPGWKFHRVNFLPRAVVVWFCAFVACWPVAYCVHYLSRFDDGSRVDRTLRDLDLLAQAVAASYVTLPAERRPPANQGGINIGVRQLLRTGVVPASLFTPAGTDQPLGLSNAWGGPIQNVVGPAGIRLDLLYVPARVCTSLLQRAHTLKGIVRLTTDGTNYLRPPVDRKAAQKACYNRSAMQIVFAAPASGTTP